MRKVTNKMKEITVSLFGKGDYADIQSAIDSIGEDEKQTTIYIKEGVYRNRVNVNKPGIRMIGQGRVIISYGIGAVHRDAYGKEYGTFRTETVSIGAPDFSAENITFVNSAGPGTFAGQALALYVRADRVKFRKCRFIGNQDTIYTGNPGEADFRCRNGIEHRQYYEDCYIEGDVDFIFGNGTAVFKGCEIYSVDRHEKEGGNNGYITAASTNPETKYGYLFLDCRLNSSAAKNTVYLGRPWRDAANVIFADCYMGAHIKPEGWHNWGKPEREETSRYSEWGSTGPGAGNTGRVAWVKQIPEEERKAISPETILRGDDGWDINRW